MVWGYPMMVNLEFASPANIVQALSLVVCIELALLSLFYWLQNPHNR